MLPVDSTLLRQAGWGGDSRADPGVLRMRPGYLVTSSHTIASFTGRLVGTPATNTDIRSECTWLEGATGQRLVVIYPQGWEERSNPGRIFDAAGAEFAREGDLVRVTFIAEGSGESGCSPGSPVAVAETVERAVPSPLPRVP